MGPLEQIDELGPLLGRVAGGLGPDDLDSPTPCASFSVPVRARERPSRVRISNRLTGAESLVGASAPGVL